MKDVIIMEGSEARDKNASSNDDRAGEGRRKGTKGKRRQAGKERGEDYKGNSSGVKVHKLDMMVGVVRIKSGDRRTLDVGVEGRGEGGFGCFSTSLPKPSSDR